MPTPIFSTSMIDPFGLLDVGRFSSPTFADIDGDGDLDAFVGGYDGTLRYFRNTGSRFAPIFATPVVNPFNLSDVGIRSTPTFADIDGDGDLDAFVGEFNGNTLFFRNTGTKNAPSFVASSNNFGLTDVGSVSRPTFADIDGDGDLDAFIGGADGNIRFYRNTAPSASDPIFAAPELNPFGLLGVGFSSSPTFADVDRDGDLDALVGTLDGITRFYRNIGNTSTPIFTTPVLNPFGLTDVGFNSSPSFVDINGDGTLDAFVGNNYGSTRYYRNVGGDFGPTAFAPPTTRPFNLAAVGLNSYPTFADIDGDGDLDAFVGERSGNTLFFRNTGTPTAPSFAAPTNPFGLTNVDGSSHPSLVDIDGDGDLDAFIGETFGNTLFYLNTGTPTAPSFVASANNFGLTDVGFFSAPTFADIDGDGDLDAFVGNQDGNTFFYRNSAAFPKLNLSPNQIVVEGLTNPQTVTYTVSLSSASPNTITVKYATSNVTATAGSDYTAKTGTLTFAPGVLTRNITIPILNDSLNEANETFRVTLSAPTNASLGIAKIATTTITDTLNAAVTTTLPANVENLTLTGANAINGTGNAGNNRLTGNAAANVLNGGAGNDTMVGGAGNDTYVVNQSLDVVSETSTVATQIDTISTAVTYTLAANVERLILAGTAVINGTGNTLNNRLTGNTAANTLNGGTGNDTLLGGSGNDNLIGGTGNDVLTGEAGADRFTFSSSSERLDTITDFVAVDDTIVVSASGFGGGLAAGSLAASQFVLGTAAADSSDRFIYNRSTGGLFFDRDGTGSIAALQIATLSTKPALTNVDILVI
jgi:Ca2+-binding RTX toxin-like protein